MGSTKLITQPQTNRLVLGCWAASSDSWPGEGGTLSFIAHCRRSSLQVASQVSSEMCQSSSIKINRQMTGCSCSHCCCCCCCSCSPATATTTMWHSFCILPCSLSLSFSALTWESFTLKSRSAFAAANKKQSNKIGNDAHRLNVADKNGDDPMLILHKFLYSIHNFSISFKFRFRLRWRWRYAMPRRRKTETSCREPRESCAMCRCYLDCSCCCCRLSRLRHLQAQNKMKLFMRIMNIHTHTHMGAHI